MENYPQGNILYNREAIEIALYNAVAYVVGPEQHDDIKQYFEKTDHVCIEELPF